MAALTRMALINTPADDNEDSEKSSSDVSSSTGSSADSDSDYEVRPYRRPRKQAPKKKSIKKSAHRMFDCYDIVVMIADCVADLEVDPSIMNIRGYTAARLRRLRSLRLVNQAFANAAARPLFREWYLDGNEKTTFGPHRVPTSANLQSNSDSRQIPVNFVQMEQFSLTPLAQHVRVFGLHGADRAMDTWGGQVTTTGSWDIRDLVEPDDPLVKDKEFDPRTNDLHILFQSWLVSRLKRFSNMRHLVIYDWAHALPALLNIAARTGLTFKSLAGRPVVLDQTTVDERAFESDAIANVVSTLKEFRWQNRHKDIPTASDRMDRIVAHQLRTIVDLRYLELSWWPTTLIPPPGCGYNDTAITKHKTLRVLRLGQVHISAVDLCNMLINNKDTLREIRLSKVELREGYWHSVLDQLSTMLPKLSELEVGELVYCYEDTALVPRTKTFKQDHYDNPGALKLTKDQLERINRMDIFGPLETLNSKDRQAYLNLVAKGSKYFFAAVEEMNRLGERAHLWAQLSRCAGAVKSTSKRCRLYMDTTYDEETGNWTYDEDGTTTTENVWFCRHHVGQAAVHAQVWPWEVASADPQP